MAEPTILTPIELTDAELDAVSGGAHISTHQHNSTRQSIHQSITETGGSVTVGGGSGATAFTGTITVSRVLQRHKHRHKHQFDHTIEH